MGTQNLEVPPMIRILVSILSVILVFAFVGCSSMGKSIVGKQQWSENYARMKGVEATAPEMIDGSLSSIGETQTPMGAGSRGATEFTEAVVKLPEKKTIRRIVVHTPNMQNFSVYATGDTEDSWKPLGEVKNNREKAVEFNVSAATNQILLRVRKTSDDEVVPGGRGSRKQLRRGKGKIQEIEIYGMEETQKTELSMASIQPGTPPGVPSVPGMPVPPVEEKPKAPAITASLESPNNSYSLTGPIPVTMNIKVGDDDLLVLADSVTDEMLKTKITVKSQAGEFISCAKPSPKLSFPKPYRDSSGKEVSVRGARTLDAGSTIMVKIPNLLDYYPINKPGTYIVQFNNKLDIHEKFLGSAQTQIEDLERTIRDINSRSNYTAQERASLIQSLREEIGEAKKAKSNKYIQVGVSGNLVDVVSNSLEIVVQ